MADLIPINTPLATGKTLINAKIALLEAADTTEAATRSAADNAETAARIAADTAHASSTTSHNATSIVFTPGTSGMIATNVDAAIKEQDTRLDNLVLNTGSSTPEIVDARLGADSVARVNLGALVREIHAMMIAAATVSSTLTHGLQQIVASQAGPMIPTIYGRTLVNILGKDGNCESLTGWTLGGTTIPTLSTTQKKSGTNSFKFAATGGTGSHLYKSHTYLLDTTKTYFIGCWIYIESYTAGLIKLRLFDVGGITTTRYTVLADTATIGSWQFVYIKVPTSNTLVGTGFTVVLGFEDGTTAVAYFDDIRLYEVSSTLYTAIGTTYTASTTPSIDDILPYVNSIQHVQNPAVTKQGKNLFDINKLSLHANAKRTSYNVITLVATATGQASSVIIPIIASQPYTLSLVGTATAGTINVYGEWQDANYAAISNTSTLYASGNTTSTAPANAKYLLIVMYGNAAGTFTFENPQLELGSVATAFVENNNDYIYGITDQFGNPIQLGSNVDGSVVDSLRFEGGVGYLTKRWMKVALDGSLAWSFPAGGDFVGFKQVRAAISGFVANVGYAVKYNGNPLVTAPNSTSWETQADKILMHTDGYIYILISDSDSGWGETYAPASESEIDAYFNGWKLNNGVFGTNYNGTGTKTWIPWGATDNTGAVTTVPTTVSTAISGGTYDYYRLSYQLAATVEEIVTVEGSIGLHSGGNQIEVLEGVIDRVVVTPWQGNGSIGAVGFYYINFRDASSSRLAKQTSRIIAIYKNGIDIDKKWIIVTNVAYYGGQGAYIPSADYDTTAVYTVTYIALDKYLMTSNVTSVLAEYQSNPRMSIDALVRSMADVETQASIIKLLLGTEYTKSGGKRIQQGSSSATIVTPGTAVTVAVTFPIAYATAPTAQQIKLTLTSSAGGTAGYINLTPESMTPTGFTARVNGYVAGLVTFGWEATAK